MTRAINNAGNITLHDLIMLIAEKITESDAVEELNMTQSREEKSLLMIAAVGMATAEVVNEILEDAA